MNFSKRSVTSQVATDYSRPIRPLFEQSPQAGTIHSISRRAVNIALADTMLALLSGELPRTPNGMRLSSVVIEQLVQSLRPGMEVWVGDGRLLISACSYSLCLPETPAWEPRPEIMGYRWQRETVARHVRLLARYLAKRSQQDGLALLVGPLLLGQVARETPLARMALPRLRMLAQASWRQDMAGVEEATCGLAGLGPGLTPSGDDVLAGFAAVMASLSAQLSADGVARGYVAEVIAATARSRTTMLSGVLLGYAARGEVAEHVGELLLALALPAEETEVVLRAAERVLAFGATSGGDTLLGVLLGLRMLEGEFDDDRVFG